MKEKVRFWGLDVHAETIAVAVAESDGEVRSLGTIANRSESIRKLVKKRAQDVHSRLCVAGYGKLVGFFEALGAEAKKLVSGYSTHRTGEHQKLFQAQHSNHEEEDTTQLSRLRRKDQNECRVS